jgi:asparagine synthase (glutamine-hydrolysing)
MPYVDAMAKRDGIENHETTFDAKWIADNTDPILWTLEEPPLAMPAFAQYRMFEFCAEHGATVIIDGQGADEISAGYPYHQRAFIKERLLRRQPLAAWRELHAIAQREKRPSASLFYDFFLRHYTQKRPQFPWIAESDPRTADPDFTFARSDYGRDSSLVNRQLYFDVHWGNVKIVLGYGDRNAMAHSIEARVPYFDRSFVELMFQLPDTFKIGHGDRKRALRDVARRYVPPEITERADRMGYGTPDEAMIRGPLFDLVTEAVQDPAFRAAEWIVPAEADRLLANFREGRHNDFRAIWRLFALSRWARRFSLTA